MITIQTPSRIGHKRGRTSRTGLLAAHAAVIRGNPFLPVMLIVLGIGILGVAGIGDVPRTVESFPFDIPAIYIALELFTAMVIATGIGDVVAIKLVTASRGRPLRTAALGVVVLISTCVLGNNLSHVGIVLPILLILLGTLAVDRRYLVAFFALVMAVVNLAGAATPVGDFPALTIMASGITSFGVYLGLAFPLFGIATTATLLGVYLLIMRRGTRVSADSALPPQSGGILLAARLKHTRLDRRSLATLAVVLAGMFACWVLLPGIPAWGVAWAGTAAGAVLAPRVRHAAHIDVVDLLPVLKISAFLAMASFVATTGVLQAIGNLLQLIHDPFFLLLAMMGLVALITSVVSAGPTAAVLLPVAIGLVGTGAPLEGMGDLVAIAFAGSICAGSSLFLISATAGPLLSKKVTAAGLLDPDGTPIDFSMSTYLRYGFLNAGVQLCVAVAAVALLFPLWSAA